MGVESHIIDDRTRLYITNSAEELDGIPAPDYGSGMTYYSGDMIFLIERSYNREPTGKEVRNDYLDFDQNTSPYLLLYGTGFKETILKPSHPEYGLPEYMTAKYDKEAASETVKVEEKKPLKLFSLVWLLLASEQ